MSVFHIIITKPAEDDLQQITEYISIELKKPSTAQYIIAKIGEAIFELEKFPLRHSLVMDERLAHQGIRKLAVHNYIVFYVANEKEKIVTIIRVLHTRRNWHYLL